MTNRSASHNNFRLRDISLNQYRYYVVERRWDSETRTKNREEDFGELLAKAVDHLGGWELTTQKNAPVIDRQKEADRLLAESRSYEGSQWIVDSKTKEARKLISRSLHDVCYLQTAVARQVEIEPDSLVDAIDNLPAFQLDDRSEDRLTVTGKCLFIEATITPSPQELNEIYVKAFGKLGADRIEPLEDQKFNFDSTHVAFSMEIERPICVIVTIDAVVSIDFVDRILPEYFLYVAKVQSEYVLADEDCKHAKTQETAINRFIKQLPNKAPGLNEMEIKSETLSNHRETLATLLNEIRRHLETMSINIRNAERLLKKPPLAKDEGSLDDLLIRPLRLRHQQIQANLSYLEIALSKLAQICEKYRDITQTRLGFYGRAIAILFGLISALGILQLFPEFEKIPPVTRIVFLMSIVIFFIYLVFWSKIANRLGQRVTGIGFAVFVVAVTVACYSLEWTSASGSPSSPEPTAPGPANANIAAQLEQK